MRSLILCAFIALLCVPSFAADPGSDKAEQEIKARSKEFSETWAKHDAKAVAAFYTTGGEIVTGTGTTMSGRDEIEQGLGDAFEHGLKDTTITETVEKVRLIKPDVAIVDSQAQLKGGDIAEGRDFHLVSVLVKKDGKWLTETSRAVVYAQQ
ncbi:MAG TPA: SgcJ/EcaC family oxidoreductase [Tepidisphaeraceae bacterium]|nr:SgcJ/EcaC family oxidoreductase [Tepidisphaeraceae bacterium]